MLSIPDAKKMIEACARNFGTETVSIDDALNRILAEDIFADRDYPPFNRATMDGYAVSSSDFKNGGKSLKIIGTVHAGETTGEKVVNRTCIKIMTGAPVPQGADAVIRFEDCVEENGVVQFYVNSVSPNQNIARQGEDATIGKLILSKNIKLNEAAISSLAVTGKSNVSVYKLPRVTIVSTGNEIVPIDAIPLPYQIRDSNAYSLKSFLKQYNISQLNCIHIPDDTEKLYKTLPGYLDVDILILSGGVSKGEADYIPEVLTALGIKEIFHRVKIKPGNPLWFGQLPSGGVVFGLPGNPVSVQIGYKIFIESFLRKCFLMEEHSPLYLPLLQERNKKTTFTEYFPCKLITRNDVTGLEPKKMNTSGDISATVGTDGIAVHPEETVMLKENTMVEFYFWNQ